MKTNTDTTQPATTRQQKTPRLPRRPTGPTAPRQPARHSPQDDGGRRLYTDFLALAFYPGMRPSARDTAA